MEGKMRIEKTELEFDEIHKGKVKPIATGGYIPFLKKFIGRIVHIIIPKEKKLFWLFKEEDLIQLKEEVKKITFENPYSEQRKEEVLSSINYIQKNKDEFYLEYLIKIINALDGKKNLTPFTKNLILKIKKGYSI